METALYFPYIRVPQTPWFSQVLLYWDQAATIVPESLRGQPEVVNPYMHELREAQLLRFLSPDEGLWRLDRRQFDRGFLSLLDTRRRSPKVEKYSRLHTGKMSYSLFRELERRGLSQQTGGPGPGWWRIETSTAGLYMAYLASVMSATMPGSMPISDRPEAIATLAGNTGGSLEQRLAALRYAVVTEALPAPQGPVPAAELRRFKEQNAEQLQRCRRYLDDKLADLATIEEAELRKVRYAAVMQGMQDDVAVLQEQMKKRRWPGVALAGFGGVMGTALATAAVVASGGAALAVGLSVGSGVMQFGTASYTAAALIRQPRFNGRAPLAYAALASRL